MSNLELDKKISLFFYLLRNKKKECEDNMEHLRPLVIFPPSIGDRHVDMYCQYCSASYNRTLTQKERAEINSLKEALYKPFTI